MSLLAAVATVCSGPTVVASAKRQQGLMEDAAHLYQRAVTVDLHSHPGRLSRLSTPEFDPSALADMRQGRLDAAFFSAVGDLPVIRREGGPSSRLRQFREPRPGELFRSGQYQLDKVLEHAKEGTLTVTLSPEDIATSKRRGVPCTLLAFEGADPLEGDLSRVKLFYDCGVRSLQLVHYRINELGDIQTELPRHGGLTSFGRDVVREMNRLGMVIDVAHATSDTLRGILAETQHPVICSHTGPYALRHIRRHLRDEDLRILGKSGGVIGVWPYAPRGETFENFLREIDYVRSVVGIDHVGIGTDILGLRDATVVPTHREFALIPAGLLSHGYSESEVVKIIGGNLLRVFREVAENRG